MSARDPLDRLAPRLAAWAGRSTARSPREHRRRIVSLLGPRRRSRRGRRGLLAALLLAAAAAGGWWAAHRPPSAEPPGLGTLVVVQLDTGTRVYLTLPLATREPSP